MVVGALGLVGHDVDVGAEAECLELAFVGAVFLLGDVTDRGHLKSPLGIRRGPFPCDGGP